MNTDMKVSVWCSDKLHRLTLTARGALVLHAHADLAAERALAAISGDMPRCLQVLEAWRTRQYAALPRRLATVRRERDVVAHDRAARRAVIDPLTLPLRLRAEQRLRELVVHALASCDYRRARSRWAGGEHRVSGGVRYDGAATITGTAERVWSRNGKWSGTNSVVKATVPLRWIRLYRRGLATALTAEGERVFVLDVLREEPLHVLAGRQRRGFQVRPWRARVGEDGTLRWLTARDLRDEMRREP